jgi:replicative superfamily II helicase
MKALAAEIARKLGKRLKWLGILVRELTGSLALIAYYQVASPINRIDPQVTCS